MNVEETQGLGDNEGEGGVEWGGDSECDWVRSVEEILSDEFSKRCHIVGVKILPCTRIPANSPYDGLEFKTRFGRVCDGSHFIRHMETSKECNHHHCIQTAAHICPGPDWERED
jgi:hypothetical protein